MSKEIEKALAELRTPSVVVVSDFDTLLDENVALAKEVLGSDWRPLESDAYMKKIRVLTLRQMHNQADKNETIKQLLVTTATGTSLDYKGLGRSVTRDEGESPYADFKFTLSSVLEHNVTIPKGTLLSSDDDKHKAETMEDAQIIAGDESVTVQVQLLELTSSSDVVTENIVTDMPFIAVTEQLESFKNGANVESDDRYRIRVIESLARFSTAGAEDAYRYYTFAADSRIDDLVVLDEEILEVHIYIASNLGVDQAMIDRVYDSCTPKKVRPLNDKVVVAAAPIIGLDVSSTIEVFDLLKAGEIEEAIRDNFHNSFFIGQDFVKSDLDRKCHVDGVYRVNTDFTDVLTNEKEIIKINSLHWI